MSTTLLRSTKRGHGAPRARPRLRVEVTRVPCAPFANDPAYPSIAAAGGSSDARRSRRERLEPSAL